MRSPRPSAAYVQWCLTPYLTRCQTLYLTRCLTPDLRTPDLRTITHRYDEAASTNGQGNLTSRTDATNVTTTYHYDAWNRPASKTYTGRTYTSAVVPGLASPVPINTPSVIYRYDAHTALPQGVIRPTSYPKGRLVEVEAGTAKTTIDAIDALGRPVITTQSYTPAGGTAQVYRFGVLSANPPVPGYEYFAGGGLKAQRYPSERRVEWTIDDANRPTAATGSMVVNGNTVPTAYASAATFAAHGAMASLRLNGGKTRETYSFDLLGRLQPELIEIATCADPANAECATRTAQLTLAYTFRDPNNASKNNGNLVRQTITVPGTGGFSATQAYGYDALNRLEQFQETQGTTLTQGYCYDAHGNRAVTGAVASSGLTPQVASCTEANVESLFPLNRWSGAAHDAAGNVTFDGTSTLFYDAENRLVEARRSGTTNTYVYDGEGRRVAKVAGTTASTFVYDAQGQLAAEYGGSAADTGTVYVHADHLGSTRLTTKGADASVHRRHDYWAFGEELFGAHTAYRTAALSFAASDADGVRTKYTGKERDAETGLDYFGARYLSSAQGRFSSPDPLLSSGRPEDPQTWNRYTYGLNNPLRYIDPTGLYEWDTTLGGSCTDKALKGGSCSGFTKAQGKDVVSQRKEIRGQLKKLDKSKDSTLHAAASAIGKENVDNGVTIGMGAVTPGAAAQVASTRPLTIDANGNPELELTVLPGAKGDALFINLAHEGTHVADAQAVARGVFPFMRHIETEMHGYLATVAAAQRLEWSSVGPTGGPPFWNSSWSKVDQQTRPPQEIFKFLLSSPIYAPKNFGVAYTK